MNSLVKNLGVRGAALSGILGHFPAPRSYTTYVEPFGGSYTVGLRLTDIPPVEIYNDTDENLWALFRTLQDEALFASFKRLADLTPYSEQLRQYYIGLLRDGGLELDIVERA